MCYQGKSFSELVDEWWSWALLNIAVLENKDGSQCALGQPFSPRSNVFFLAGLGFGGSSITRTECHAPENKFLFFPFITVNYGIFPVVEPGPDYWRRTFTNPLINNVNSLSFTFDGQEGTIPGGGSGFTYSEPETADLFAYRGQSPPGGGVFDFSAAYGPDLCDTCPADLILPGVSDGYWLLLAPPSPGEHELKFSAVAASETLSLRQNVTYNPLTIVGSD